MYPPNDKIEPPLRYVYKHNRTTSAQTTVQSLSIVSGKTYGDRPKPSLFDKLGVWNTFIIFIGTLSILGALGFLWFLWSSTQQNSLWRWLVISGYLQRSVTLSSASLRTIVAFQSSLCTSMIAGSIMELSTGFSISHSASLSIQRFNGGQPFNLLRPSLKGRTWYLLVIAVLLSATTIASYFISTGLVSDLGIAPIIGNPQVHNAPYSLYTETITSITPGEPDYTTFLPSIYPAFGEYSEDPVKSDGVDDTGHTLRALLPITSAAERQAVSNYSGVGTLLNSHVVCVKPTIDDFRLITNQAHPFVTGGISIGNTMPAGLEYFNFMNATIDRISPFALLNFSCVFTFFREEGDWPISMCIAGNYGETLEKKDEETGNAAGRFTILGLRSTSLLYSGILNDPLSYILLNYTGDPQYGTGDAVSRNWTDISTNASIWRVYRMGASRAPKLETVSITYCFPHFAAIDTNFTLHSPLNRTEPSLRGRKETALGLDATDVLLQLGADGSNANSTLRGILQLEYTKKYKEEMNDTSNPTVLEGTYGFGMVYNMSITDPVTDSWALCTGCGSGDYIFSGSTGISPALSSIFQSTLGQSGSPARALQALLTTLSMMQYYSRLQQFEISGSYVTRLVEQQLQPVRVSGLIAVTVGIALHVALVMTTATIFFFRTSKSFIGESWHTVAQLQSQDIIPILEGASMMKDDEVEAWLETSRVKDDKMGLREEDGDERHGAHVVRNRLHQRRAYDQVEGNFF